MRHLIITILFITSSLSSMAQLEKYKAIFLYKFAQNFKWPSDKISDSYKIGIYGDNNLYDELSTLVNGRSIDNKPMEVVKYMPQDNNSDLCMLFISDDYRDSFELLSKSAKINSTVIVGESSGLAKKGAPLNFVTSGGSLKFELNESSLNEYKVKVSGSIRSLAILIN